MERPQASIIAWLFIQAYCLLYPDSEGCNSPGNYKDCSSVWSPRETCKCEDNSCFPLIHAKQEYCINGEYLPSHEIFAEVDINSYLYASESFPGNPYHRPSVANGHIGTVIHGRTVYMNCLYNGHRDGKSHRAELPSTIDVNITHTNPERKFTRSYQMDGLNGEYVEELVSGDLNITQTVYAHRDIPALLVLDVQAQASKAVLCNSNNTVNIFLDVSGWWKSRDIDFSVSPSGTPGVKLQVGRIKVPETEASGHTAVFVYYDTIPAILHMDNPQVKWVFLTSIHTVQEDALAQYNQGARLLQADELRSVHRQAWHNLWSKGRVDISDASSLSKLVTASFFYTLSSLPLSENSSFCGLSPNGLPWGGRTEDYWGHYLWDQSTWMYPPILLTHVDMAKTMLNTRVRTMPAAAENSRRLGLSGLKYPWEAAFTGVETANLNSSYANQELHIDGDVSVALMQYYWLTHDRNLFFKEKFDEVILGIADFWISKLQYNVTRGLYVINDVQPPDEYASSVNNSVYTNVVAKKSLQSAAYVARMKGSRLLSKLYSYCARRLYIPFDKENGYHPEYDGYQVGSLVKQADVVLLGYPLMFNMSQEIRKRDLEIYENVTAASGPAMTWTMFGIGWLELGEPQRAWSHIRKVFNNVVNGFQIWSEISGGRGAPNFLTGMGGFLQSIMSGYGGIRLKSDRLEINPLLPPDCEAMNFTGVDYLGHSVDLRVSNDTIILTAFSGRCRNVVSVCRNGAQVESLCLYRKSVKITTLVTGIPVALKRQKYHISNCDHNKFQGNA